MDSAGERLKHKAKRKEKLCRRFPPLRACLLGGACARVVCLSVLACLLLWLAFVRCGGRANRFLHFFPTLCLRLGAGGSGERSELCSIPHLALVFANDCTFLALHLDVLASAASAAAAAAVAAADAAAGLNGAAANNTAQMHTHWEHARRAVALKQREAHKRLVAVAAPVRQLGEKYLLAQV